MWIELKSECTQNTVYHIIISHMLYISQYLWYLTHSQLLQLNVYGHLVTNISPNTHLVYLNCCVQNWTSWIFFEILKPWFIALWVVSSQVWKKRNVTHSQGLHLLSAYWNLIVDRYEIVTLMIKKEYFLQIYLNTCGCAFMCRTLLIQHIFTFFLNMRMQFWTWQQQ